MAFVSSPRHGSAVGWRATHHRVYQRVPRVVEVFVWLAAPHAVAAATVSCVSCFAILVSMRTLKKTLNIKRRMESRMRGTRDVAHTGRYDSA